MWLFHNFAALILIDKTADNLHLSFFVETKIFSIYSIGFRKRTMFCNANI